MCEGVVYPKRIRGTANTQVAIEPILSKYHLKQVGEIRDAVVTGGGGGGSWWLLEEQGRKVEEEEEEAEKGLGGGGKGTKR